MPVVYLTASTLNGFLADPDDSLAWLFEVPGPAPDLAPFLDGVTVLVLGSTTYEWLLREEHLLEQPERWHGWFGDRPLVVFTSRTLPVPDGVDVRFVAGPVAEHLPALRAAAGDGTIWVQGGGDLAGQFLDAGALDEISISFAPATLAAGRPLLPRDLRRDRLRLTRVEQVGEFAVLTYAVLPPPG